MERNGRVTSHMLAWLAGGALLGASVVPAAAAPPADLQDLEGVRASSGEGMLRSRGYERISGTTGKDRQWAYWWNRSKDQCASVTTYQGRYEAIEKTSDKDCGKSSGSGSGAAVAVGAVALIGALALATSHKDKNKDRDRYDSYPPGSSATTPYELRNLIGIRASSGERELRDRGYKFQSAGSGSYSRWAYWWNKRENQCIAVTTYDGRYESIVTSPASSCGKGGGGYYPDQGYGSQSYSPAQGITCYPRQRTCYEDRRGYSAYWTAREFRY